MVYIIFALGFYNWSFITTNQMSHNTHMYVYPVGLYNKIKEIPTGTFGHLDPNFILTMFI